MRTCLSAILLASALALPAAAEPGRITLAPGGSPVTIDAARLQGDAANSYAVSVTGKADGLLSITLQPTQRSLSLKMRLLDMDNGTLLEVSADEPGKVTRLEMPIGAGNYTLEVTDNAQVTRLKPYRLTGRFVPASDAFEPNNAFETAKPLTNGQAATITLFRFKEADQDFFAYTHAGGMLSVAVSPLKDVQPGIVVYSADREELGSASAANGGAAVHYTAEHPAGSYFVMIQDHAQSNQTATLTVTVSSQ